MRQTQLEQRKEELERLKKSLLEGPRDRRLTVYSYLQILDYHIALVDEVNKLVCAIRDGNKEFIHQWYMDRIGLKDE